MTADQTLTVRPVRQLGEFLTAGAGVLALVALVAFAVAPAGWRFGLWYYTVAFAIMRYAAYVALAAVASRRRTCRIGDRNRRRLCAVALCAAGRGDATASRHHHRHREPAAVLGGAAVTRRRECQRRRIRRARGGETATRLLSADRSGDDDVAA